jgi:hypothetical protein
MVGALYEGVLTWLLWSFCSFCVVFCGGNKIATKSCCDFLRAVANEIIYHRMEEIMAGWMLERVYESSV